MKKKKKNSNVNGVGNPKIGIAGKKTQFQKGNKVAVGNKSMTYRSQLKWLRDQPIDPNDIDGSIRRLLGMPLIKGKNGQPDTGHRLNISRVFVIRYLERALKKVDPDLFERIINQTEGKLKEDAPPPGATAGVAIANEVSKIITNALVKQREKELESEF